MFTSGIPLNTSGVALNTRGPMLNTRSTLGAPVSSFGYPLGTFTTNPTNPHLQKTVKPCNGSTEQLEPSIPARRLLCNPLHDPQARVTADRDKGTYTIIDSSGSVRVHVLPQTQIRQPAYEPERDDPPDYWS